MFKVPFVGFGYRKMALYVSNSLFPRELVVKDLLWLEVKEAPEVMTVNPSEDLRS